ASCGRAPSPSLARWCSSSRTPLFACGSRKRSTAPSAARLFWKRRGPTAQIPAVRAS
ncbi:unnamed protein product, partial [Effrenium voratum]